eukprot:m.178286 g.178286  ORF g.178286 m.178286 type:complete len:499 (-) comp14516_c0_seq1:19-1515(-)
MAADAPPGMGKPDLPDTAAGVRNFCTTTQLFSWVGTSFAHMHAGLAFPAGPRFRMSQAVPYCSQHKTFNDGRSPLRKAIIGAVKPISGRVYGFTAAKDLSSTNYALGNGRYDPCKRKQWSADDLARQLKMSGVQAILARFRLLQFAWNVPPKEFNELLDSFSFAADGANPRVLHPMLGLQEDSTMDDHGLSPHENVKQILQEIQTNGTFTPPGGEPFDIDLDDPDVSPLAMHADDEVTSRPTTLDRYLACMPVGHARDLQCVGICELVALDVDPCKIRVWTRHGVEPLFENQAAIPPDFVQVCKTLWEDAAFGGRGFIREVQHTFGARGLREAAKAIRDKVSSNEWRIVGIMDESRSTFLARQKRRAGEEVVKLPSPITLARFMARAPEGDWASGDDDVDGRSVWMHTVIGVADACGIDWDESVACLAASKRLAMSRRPKEWLAGGTGPVASKEVNKLSVLRSAAGRSLVLAALIQARTSELSDEVATDLHQRFGSAQ